MYSGYLGYKLGKIYTKIKKMDPDKTYKNLHHLDNVAHVARDEHNGFFSLPLGCIGDPEVRKLWIRTIEADIKVRDKHIEKQIKKTIQPDSPPAKSRKAVITDATCLFDQLFDRKRGTPEFFGVQTLPRTFC